MEVAQKRVEMLKRAFPDLRGSELCRPAHFRFAPKADVRSDHSRGLKAPSRRHSASVSRVSVLRKFNQGVDRQARILAGLDHQVANGPTVCTVWIEDMVCRGARRLLHCEGSELADASGASNYRQP